MFWRLLSQRDLYDQVVDEPTLIPAAVEESLRFDAPVLGLYRTNTEEISLHGVSIPERSKVMATYGAANRDPNISQIQMSFALTALRKNLGNTFRLDLEDISVLVHNYREWRPNLLSKEVSRRFPNLRLVSNPKRIEPFLLWGRKELAVRWD